MVRSPRTPIAVALALGFAVPRGGVTARAQEPEAERGDRLERSAPACPSGMIGIPAGTFRMGDDETTDKAGRVQVGAFCMDATEVTAAAYDACVASGDCSAADPATDSNACNSGRPELAEHPINCIDWSQASAFCAAQGKRLPTEEEWEYAARGADGRIFPWGNAEPDDQLCWTATSQGDTCAVGSFVAGLSPFGLADMAGNVREWTSSRSDDADGERVSRGGGWMDVDPSYVRAASRFRDEASERNEFVGFRCAR